jgi:uncharacterized protein YceH (UPF0502 family)
MNLSLDPVESRILGCLLEKERTTPENYPLSLNALTNACNQSTNRDPVVAWDEATVEAGLDRLRVKKLAAMLHAAGSRVPKYRHLVPDQFQLSRAETALLAVLLLRGPQTSGELRARTERYHTFASIEDVESTLAALSAGDLPLATLLPARHGQKERRHAQLLSPVPDESALQTATIIPHEPAPSRMDALENVMQTLRAELQSLREEFASFKKQFE